MASSTSKEWLQFSEQTSTDHQYNRTNQTASNPYDFPDQNHHHHHHHHHHQQPPMMINHPQSSISKPIRRRSRASKKTPTTLLNATSANFRSLVQRFTGCPSPTIPVSLATRKGPVNLNFGSLVSNNGDYYQSNYQRITSSLPSFPAYHQYVDQPQHRLLHEEDPVQRFGSGSGSGNLNPGDQADMGMDFDDGFSMDDDAINLHDLLNNVSTTSNSFP